MVDAHLYYSTVENQEKIAKECKYREVIIIKHTYKKKIVIRPFKIFKPEHFQWIYKFLYLDIIPFDIYISNASVRLPKLPNNLKDLSNARNRLNIIWEKIMTGYDFFVDFDAATENDEHQLTEWAQFIKKQIQHNGSVDLWKTGSGGIHLVQKGRFDPEYCRKTITQLCNKHDIPLRTNTDGPPYVDDSIYDLRRIRRVPWAIYSKTGMIMEPIK